MPFNFKQCLTADGTIIEGLFEVFPKVFEDSRGYFFESYSQHDFESAGIAIPFVQDNQSRSGKGVLRGLHFQKNHPQGKLVRVIEGEVFDVAVDIRPESPTRGKWYGVVLNVKEQNQFYIPPGFAHGFLVLSETCVFAYKCTDFYHPNDEGGIIWNDPSIGIEWPALSMEYILSEKDKKLPGFNSMTNATVEFPRETPKLFSKGKQQIWLIGNKGMLGTELSLLLEKNNIPFTGTDREIDITNRETVLSFATNLQKPVAWIINCAAYTAVDKAEDDQTACRLLNTGGAANIAAAAKTVGTKLIHISTDYVFNGQENRPYTEEDATDPIGVYGLTKRDAETRVLEENAKSYIIRTAWLYGRYGNNFVNTMLKLMDEREEIKVVNDQYGSPTWAYDLAQVIISLMVNGGNHIPCGIYNFTNEGNISWFEFAKAIYEEGKNLHILNKPCAIKPCTSAEYPAKVKRPAYSVLDKTKIKKTLALEIPDWKDSLKKHLTITSEQK
jgi:dTDP-4-dehydrorhamnose reductase